MILRCTCIPETVLSSSSRVRKSGVKRTSPRRDGSVTYTPDTENTGRPLKYMRTDAVTVHVYLCMREGGDCADTRIHPVSCSSARSSPRSNATPHAPAPEELSLCAGRYTTAQLLRLLHLWGAVTCSALAYHAPTHQGSSKRPDTQIEQMSTPARGPVAGRRAPDGPPRLQARLPRAMSPI